MVAPRWLGRIAYAFRGKRKVRLHLEDKPGISNPSLEGFLIGRWAGHYILAVPKLVHGEAQSVALEGMIEVPIERVVFVQVLPS